MSCASKFASYRTMISYSFSVIINEFFTNPASVTWLKLLFFFLTPDQIVVKVFFHYFFTILILFKNRFNQFISSIFTSKNNYWFGKFTTNTKKFVSETTRNVILIFYWVEPFITFYVFQITFKIGINFKWKWYLFEITINAQTNFFMFCQYIFNTETL